MEQKRKGKPPRLERVFQKYDAPLFFLTFNTHARRRLLTTPGLHAAFEDYCRRASEHGAGVGRYVLMPDHVHLFMRLGAGSEIRLGEWIKGLKRRLDRVLLAAGHEPIALPGQALRSFWQPGFFDHLLRSDESYAGKWNYVRENPVRAGLVSSAEDWPYAGEIVRIDRAQRCSVRCLSGLPCTRVLAQTGALRTAHATTRLSSIVFHFRDCR